MNKPLDSNRLLSPIGKIVLHSMFRIAKEKYHTSDEMVAALDPTREEIVTVLKKHPTVEIAVILSFFMDELNRTLEPVWGKLIKAMGEDGNAEA